jgi:hypothetical protein
MKTQKVLEQPSALLQKYYPSLRDHTGCIKRRMIRVSSRYEKTRQHTAATHFFFFFLLHSRYLSSKNLNNYLGAIYTFSII